MPGVEYFQHTPPPPRVIMLRQATKTNLHFTLAEIFHGSKVLRNKGRLHRLFIALTLGACATRAPLSFRTCPWYASRTVCIFADSDFRISCMEHNENQVSMSSNSVEPFLKRPCLHATVPPHRRPWYHFRAIACPTAMCLSW